jgi:mercuric ion transport protein
MLGQSHDRHKESFVTETPRPPKGIGTATLTLAGIAAAFGVAACCALPILLASAGIGAAWLGGVAVVTAPYCTPLLLIAALCLVTGGALLLRQQLVAARCGPTGVCTPRWMRMLTLFGLLLGAALLWAGYRYV